MSINNSQQEHFWEVALAKDRKAFIAAKAFYAKGASKSVRLDRNHKVAIVSTQPVVRRGVSVTLARLREKSARQLAGL